MTFRKKLQLYILPVIIISILIVTSVVGYISVSNIQELQYDIMRYRLDVVEEYIHSEYATLERVKLQEVDLYVSESKERVFDFISNITVPGGNFLIINSEAELLFHTDPTKVTVNMPIETNTYLKNNLLNDEIVTYIFENNTYLSHYDYFEPWDWYIMVVVDRQVIFESINNAIKLAVMTAVATIIIAFVLVHVISRSISKPVEGLTAGTISLKQGDYSTRISNDKEDEFGDLADSFNMMAEEIEDQFTQVRTKSENLSLLASFAAGMSHDLKTPIGNTTTVITYMETELNSLRDAYENDNLSKEFLENYLETGRESVDILNKNNIQATELVSGYKTVSVDQLNREKRSINLEDYINEVLMALRPRIKNTKHLIQVSSEEPIITRTYPGAISQIVTNLIMNSLVHGFENIEKGIIQIEIKRIASDISIVYKDDGIGITKENLTNIYDAFFTTKHNQGGSGLGMHIIYNLVKSLLHGTVDCKSDVGKGVEFTIIIPDESFDS